MSTQSRWWLLALVGLSVAACGEQTEGERCDKANSGDADCDGGLVCVSRNELPGDVDRCCPPADEPTGTDLCDRRTDTTPEDFGGGGAAGSGSGGASAGAAGASTGADGAAAGSSGAAGSGASLGGVGQACSYTSECSGALVCGPGGECQVECQGDRDCDTGRCDTSRGVCVAAP